MSRTFLASYITKCADVTTGMDILARAQFWEGAAGYKTFQKISGRTSSSSLLNLIRELMEEVASGLSTKPGMEIWYANGNVGLYKAVLVEAARRVESKGLNAADLMQSDMTRTDLIGSVFYAAGVGIRSRKNAALVAGEVLPKEATNLARRFMVNHALDALRNGRKRKVLLNDRAEDIATNSMSGNPDPGGWLNVIEGLLQNPADPLAGEFFDWVRGLAASTGKPALVGYLERVLAGDTTMSKDMARDLGVSEVTLSTLKSKFFATVAKKVSDMDLDSSNTPQVLRDLANRAELAGLTKTHGTTYRSRELQAGLRTRLIRLAHANPALRPHLLPLLAS